MKLFRSLIALPLALALLMLPARAAQQSFVMPSVGPLSMGSFVTTYLNPGLQALGSCHLGISAPANGPGAAPMSGQCWWDTSGTPWNLKFYYGAGWSTPLGTLNASTGIMSGIATTLGSPAVVSGTVTPAQVTGDQDDYAATNGADSCTNKTVLRLSTDASRNVTGLSCGQADGALRVIQNDGSNTLVLKDQNISSAVANRFLFGADVTVGANKAIVLLYDGATGRWRSWDRSLVNTGVTAGTYGSATQAPQFAVDIQGRITSASSITITPAFSALTGTPTTLSGYGISDAQPLDSDLTALAGNSTNGLWAHTGAGTGTARTVTGTAAEIAVSNGDGVSGSPTLSLPSSLTFTGKTITGGSFATPALTGMPTTPTAAPGTNTTQIASTAYADAIAALKANAAAPAFTGLADVQGAIKFSTQSAPAQIAANQDNYNPSSVICASTETLLINSDAARNVTGLGGGVAGCRLTLVNNGAFTITLKNLTTSTAGNQFSNGGDVALDANKSVWLVYDGTATKWRVYSPPLAGAGSGTVTSVACGTGLSGGTITVTGTCAISLSTATNSLSGDVNLNNTANYFDGPSMAQGTSGTWWVSGTVTLQDTGSAAEIYCKLWDGTTVIASGANFTAVTGGLVSTSLSGFLAAPAANIKISCRDSTNTTGKILFNRTGNSKDSTISGLRIQ